MLDTPSGGQVHWDNLLGPTCILLVVFKGRETEVLFKNRDPYYFTWSKRGRTKHKKAVSVVYPIPTEREVIKEWFEPIGLGDDPTLLITCHTGPRTWKQKGEVLKGPCKYPWARKYYFQG